MYFSSPSYFNVEELTSLLNYIVAPFKVMCPKPKTEPWINDITRAVRRECKRAEHQWKKDKLRVSFDILKETWNRYQKTVKAEKTKYLSNMILNNSHKPKVLFSTINAVLNPSQPTVSDVSPHACEIFLKFFVDKVIVIRADLIPPSTDPSIPATCSAVFDQFEPVSLSF